VEGGCVCQWPRAITPAQDRDQITASVLRFVGLLGAHTLAGSTRGRYPVGMIRLPNILSLLAMFSVIGTACTQTDLPYATVQPSPSAKAQVKTSTIAPARPTPTMQPSADSDRPSLPLNVVPPTSTPSATPNLSAEIIPPATPPNYAPQPACRSSQLPTTTRQPTVLAIQTLNSPPTSAI